MESYRTLDLEAAFLTPVGYGNFRVFFQVLQRLIEKLVRNKKRFVIQKLKRPNRDNVRGTSLEAVARNTILVPVSDSLISSVSLTMYRFSSLDNYFNQGF